MKSGVCVKKGVPPEASSFLLNYLEFSKEKGIFQKVMVFMELNSKGLTFKLLSIKKLWKKRKTVYKYRIL